MTDVFHNIHPVTVIAPAAATTDNTPLVGAIIDRKGFDALTFVIAAGDLADADATFAVLVEDGDAANLSDAEPVADAALLGTEAAARLTFGDDNEPRKIGYRGDKRYVRLTITPSGNSGDAYLAAIAILGTPHVAPTANPPV
ncbi:MAG: hypothetical protein GC199_06895 [Alphaproteobacteria bacterium]|nr:hypothetical protein [Alphaproteobacteria bacterium]